MMWKGSSESESPANFPALRDFLRWCRVHLQLNRKSRFGSSKARVGLSLAEKSARRFWNWPVDTVLALPVLNAISKSGENSIETRTHTQEFPISFAIEQPIVKVLQPQLRGADGRLLGANCRGSTAADHIFCEPARVVAGTRALLDFDQHH